MRAGNIQSKMTKAAEWVHRRTPLERETMLWARDFWTKIAPYDKIHTGGFAA